MVKQHPPRVTRTDVARMAGTSVAVVSYVINNGPRPVAEKTRQRVLEAIRLSGYRPNGVARALASGTTQTFGLIVPGIGNPFVGTAVHELLQASLKHGHVLLLGDAGDNSQCELELIHAMLNRQVDGLFYASLNHHPWVEVIKASGTPFVVLGRVDEHQAAQLATRHLVEHGYEKIGIISGPPDTLHAQERFDGWREAMNAGGLPINARWNWPASYTREGGYGAAQQMLQQDELPRALFVSNEAQAIGCIRALTERGIRVPDEVALVCFNGTEQSAFSVPTLTHVRQPLGEVAKAAVALLENGDGSGELPEIPYALVLGESCGCRTTPAEDITD